ncbi:MAG: ABC transporter ATP-binding protein [Limnospira sp. PMC 1291.21]|uniref:ABC transporter ATP-binding protein n=3 Tax=Limnospira TaxID=2596745 RepID=A0ABU9EEK0_LIMFS|nr:MULTISPECIES: ABC transporter ATP-binding protein [Limnospira]MDY7053450.1 ABC transporter ATP-binding protein [Limnospira fusiformis LS22]QJB26088.1 ABC transporter ATP-binding protein [Limnospira fusiformis SAG 85.79]MDT9177812.1 ABC transporter ATP-binding protein [Limnospira sp. PMC 1238.20]MDT9187907.1 ABC transporter ATP-binding protein [Limnospira sp. PMC 894.15]MDT9193094.1 ABC transporter ATP-binding protein [Limnospira sp. PMC 1245.20]
MPDFVLDVKNLQVQFKSDQRITRAVDQISFQVKPGQTLGIVGESGSGKSVTSLAIMGLLSPATSQVGGEIWFRPGNPQADEADHNNDSTEGAIDLLQLPESQKQQFRGGEISMIFQEPMSSLNPVYTIGFQLIEAIRQHQDITPREGLWKATSLLQEVKLLPSDEQILKQLQLETPPNNDDINNPPSQREWQTRINDQKRAFLDRYPHELSGGQLQRVMIAMAISCNPTLLIADEPTTALDVTVQATILDLLRELRDRRGMSIIFITHDFGVIAEIADTVAVMYQGKIVELNPIHQLFNNPQHPYTKGLLACRPTLETRRGAKLPTIADFMEVVSTESGTKIRGIDSQENLANETRETAEKVPSNPDNSPLLSVQNLRVGFKIPGVLGGTQRLFMAVDDVSFDVFPGETLGLVGESGCGKSTLSRAILQLILPHSGRVIFAGEDITNYQPSGPWINRLKDYRQRREFQQKMKWVRREMQIVFQDPFSSLDPRLTIGDAVMEPLLIHSVGNYKQRRDRTAYLLERVGLNPDFMRRYPHEFSGGQRQRICIARSLALNPKFIICDESVSALDVSVQAQVLNLLRELQREFELTYIFISHDLSVVKFMSDRIVVMNQGKIEEIGDSEEIYRHPQQEYTRRLIASIPTGDIQRVAS